MLHVSAMWPSSHPLALPYIASSELRVDCVVHCGDSTYSYMLSCYVIILSPSCPSVYSVKRACQASPDKMACHAKKCTFLLGSVAVLADMEKAMATMNLDVTLGNHPPLDEVSKR